MGDIVRKLRGWSPREVLYLPGLHLDLRLKEKVPQSTVALRDMDLRRHSRLIVGVGKRCLDLYVDQKEGSWDYVRLM